MSKIIDSLKDNLEHIISNIPAELHEIAKKEIETLEVDAVNSAEQELELIKNELTSNPTIDESLVGEIDPTAHRAPAPPSEDEQKAAMEKELEATKTACQ